jgi:2-C-methyl-D-erythritol 2,4-cyclodiphosphate synthase
METQFRIGNGFDIHRTSDARTLILGGIKIPEGPGLDGHSDADVLVHALMDALLGALGLDDIGVLFPNTDKRYKGISSIELLKQVVGRLGEWKIVNVDLTLVAERPKIAPYRHAIKETLAAALRVSTDCVGIKATTAEGLGSIGAGNGMQAFAVALLSKSA